MREFEEGDRVRVDIPDVTDPDHEQYYGEHGTVLVLMAYNIMQLAERFSLRLCNEL